MFRTKLLLILPLLVAVTLGQANRSEQGQWLFLSPGRPMLVTGLVIAAPEAPVPISIPASQPGEPDVVVPLSDEPVSTGELAPVTEQPPASVQNVYNIIYLQYEPVVQPEPVTQYPSTTPMVTPLLPKTQPVREPSVRQHQSSVPPMTSGPTDSHPSSFAVAPPQPSAVGEPQPPVKEAAFLAPPVVVTRESHPAVTQAPKQLMFDGQSKEGNGYYPVETPIAPAPVLDGPSAPAAPPALPAPSYAPAIRPRPLYTPLHRPLRPPRPIRPAPPAVAPPQASAIVEPQPPVTKTAPLAPPVVVTTQSHPAVTQAPGQLMFDFQCKEENGYYSVEHECDTYIECKQNRAMKYTCPDGLHFNPAAKYNENPCAYPSEVKCVPCDQEQSSEPTAVCARIEPVVQPEPVTQYPPPTPMALPPFPPMTSYATGSHPTQTPSPARTVATQAPPVVVSTQSHPAVTQAPMQFKFDGQGKEANGYYPVEAPFTSAPILDGPSTPAAPPALAAPSHATVLHPRPHYTPVYRRLLSPRPIRLAPPAVAPPQLSAIGEPQPPVKEAAPPAAPVVVTTQSHPAVTQAPTQFKFDGQSKEGNGYYPVEAPITPAPILDGPSAPAAPPALPDPSYAPVIRPRPLYTPVHRPLRPPRPIRPAPQAVAPPQASAIVEPQPPVTKTAPLAPPVVVTTQSHPAVTQAPGQLMFDFQCKEENGYSSVEHECDTYIECKQNRAMKYTCPDGLHFNPAAKYNENPCAYPSEVKCMPCDQEQSSEPTAVCARIEPVVQPEPVTQYPPPTPMALPPFPPMTSYPTGSHPTQTPSPPRTVATQVPPVVVSTQSYPAVTQAPMQFKFDGQSKEGNGYYPVEAPFTPAPILNGLSAPAAPPALAAPSNATVLHPRPLYNPVYRRLLSPSPIRLAPPAVAPPQLSAIGEPQPPVKEAAPLAAPVVVTTQTHPAVTQAPGQLMFDFQCKEEIGYYSVEHECDTYIECKQNRAMKYTCPDGLHFNPAAKYNENPCAYPSEVKCRPGDQEQSLEPTAECPRKNGFYSMSNGDCSQYIRCHEGYATIMKCPEGLAFNPQLDVCDWPANVTQCNRNEGEMK